MVESVVINTAEENSGPTLEEQAAAMDMPVEKPEENLPSDADSRPEWLPEKFSSVEEMAKSYNELEARMAQGDVEAAEDLTEEAVEQVESAGLDFDALSAEYYENGGLSDAAYDALAQGGIPRDIVDQYIAATEQAQEASRNSVMEEVGGADVYNDMLEWAGENLSDAEIDAYNRAMDTQDYDQISMAVKGLAAMRSAAVGSEPARNLSGGVRGDQGGQYESVAQLMSDMNDPRYGSDAAFRAKVEAKLGRSSIL